MLYTKFVRTNRTLHEYVRGARRKARHTDACGHAQDTHTHPAGLRTITHGSVRHAQQQHTIAVTARRSRVAVTQPARKHESHRCRHESYRYAYESHETGTRTQAQPTVTATGRRSQVAGRLSRFVISSAARSRRSQSQVAGAADSHTRTGTGAGATHLPARNTQPRAGAGAEAGTGSAHGTAQQSTRHGSTIRYDTARHV